VFGWLAADRAAINCGVVEVVIALGGCAGILDGIDVMDSVMDVVDIVKSVPASSAMLAVVGPSIIVVDADAVVSAVNDASAFVLGVVILAVISVGVVVVVFADVAVTTSTVEVDVACAVSVGVRVPTVSVPSPKDTAVSVVAVADVLPDWPRAHAYVPAGQVRTPNMSCRAKHVLSPSVACMHGPEEVPRQPVHMAMVLDVTVACAGSIVVPAVITADTHAGPVSASASTHDCGPNNVAMGKGRRHVKKYFSVVLCEKPRVALGLRWGCCCGCGYGVDRILGCGHNFWFGKERESLAETQLKAGSVQPLSSLLHHGSPLATTNKHPIPSKQRGSVRGYDCTIAACGC